jgi:lipoprotein-anchoring transpeptidase ErfK/SrfK
VKAIFFAASLIAAGIAATPAMAASSAVSLEEAAATLTPNAYVWQDNGQGGPVRIVVSLADQRAYIYRGPSLIAVSTVSSGKDGKETPTGTFPILQKETMHKSNLYESAPMPFMQRLTWDGVALHAGNNPGFPASHGCIRLPAAFAKKLFEVTRVGTTVSVTDESVSGEPADLVPSDMSEVALDAETARANAQQLASNR